MTVAGTLQPWTRQVACAREPPRPCRPVPRLDLERGQLAVDDGDEIEILTTFVSGHPGVAQCDEDRTEVVLCEHGGRLLSQRAELCVGRRVELHAKPVSVVDNVEPIPEKTGLAAVWSEDRELDEPRQRGGVHVDQHHGEERPRRRRDRVAFHAPILATVSRPATIEGAVLREQIWAIPATGRVRQQMPAIQRTPRAGVRHRERPLIALFPRPVQDCGGADSENCSVHPLGSVEQEPRTVVRELPQRGAGMIHVVQSGGLIGDGIREDVAGGARVHDDAFEIERVHVASRAVSAPIDAADPGWWQLITSQPCVEIRSALR